MRGSREETQKEEREFTHAERDLARCVTWAVRDLQVNTSDTEPHQSCKAMHSSFPSDGPCVCLPRLNTVAWLAVYTRPDTQSNRDSLQTTGGQKQNELTVRYPLLSVCSIVNKLSIIQGFTKKHTHGLRTEHTFHLVLVRARSQVSDLRCYHSQLMSVR